MSRYSQLYIERGARSSDSERARRRLRAVFNRLVDAMHVRDRIGRDIVEFQGCNISSFSLSVGIDYDFDEFFSSAEIRDVLDAITTIFDVLVNEYQPDIPKEWTFAVGTIFEEE